MKITDEHLKVLRLIKDECIKNDEGCENCLFYENGETLCLLHNHIKGGIWIPNEWDLDVKIKE